MRLVLAIAITWLIMNVATFVVYGSVSALFGLQPPQDESVAAFLVSVLVVKVGLAIGFVGLFAVARQTWIRRWVLYAFIWWLMFVVVETGQAIGPGYSWLEAVAGVIAEIIYCLLAAGVTATLLEKGRAEDASA